MKDLYIESMMDAFFQSVTELISYPDFDVPEPNEIWLRDYAILGKRKSEFSQQKSNLLPYYNNWLNGRKILAVSAQLLKQLRKESLKRIQA